MKILLYIMFLYNAYSLINKHLLRNVDPVKMREYLKTKLEKNYEYKSYEYVKKTFHKYIDFIDIYGNHSNVKNMEHVYPQSLFKHDNKFKYMKSDMHNLYLCNAKLNMLKQNYKYVDKNEFFTDKKYIFYDKNERNIDNIELMLQKEQGILAINNNKKLFLPHMHSRGIISRSLAYFIIKYDYLDKINDVIDLHTMINWNYEYCVSKEEYIKNMVIMMHQRNNNLFISYPELMYYAFSDKVDMQEICEKYGIQSNIQIEDILNKLN